MRQAIAVVCHQQLHQQLRLCHQQLRVTSYCCRVSPAASQLTGLLFCKLSLQTVPAAGALCRDGQCAGASASLEARQCSTAHRSRSSSKQGPPCGWQQQQQRQQQGWDAWRACCMCKYCRWWKCCGQ
jgi:hypothetical protein